MQSGLQARSQSLPPWLVTSGRRRVASPLSRLQWAAAAVAFVVAALVLSSGLYPSTSRWLLVPLAPALVLRRGRAYLRDFVPFALLVLLYEWLRTEAHHVRPHAYYSPQLDIDKAIGFGTVPTVWLQRQLYDGRPRAFDHAMVWIHSMHFAVPVSLLFAIWLVSRSEARRFAAGLLATAFLADLGFLLFPAAPPWLAAQQGILGPLTRIRSVGFHDGAVDSLAHRLFDDNPVAAVPSLHAAWSLLVVLAVWRVWPRLTWLALLYAFLQQFAVVYLGEHYVFDVICGDVLALVVWAVLGRLAPAPRAARARRGQLVPRRVATSESIS